MDAPDDLLCNCLAVRQAARQLTQLYDEELAHAGLRSTQFALLMRLAQLQPATMQELADALVLDRTTLTHNLKPLEREGLVLVGKDPADQRTRRLRLSAKGKTTLRAAREAWRRAQQRFEHAFGAEQAASLRAQLARVVDVLR